MILKDSVVMVVVALLPKVLVHFLDEPLWLKEVIV
jgi:hypothetical protein